MHIYLGNILFVYSASIQARYRSSMPLLFKQHSIHYPASIEAAFLPAPSHTRILLSVHFYTATNSVINSVSSQYRLLSVDMKFIVPNYFGRQQLFTLYVWKFKGTKIVSNGCLGLSEVPGISWCKCK